MTDYTVLSGQTLAGITVQGSGTILVQSGGTLKSVHAINETTLR